MTGIMMAGGTSPPALTASRSPSFLSWSFSGVFYDSGTATATPSGGTGPYTYAWEQVSGDDIVFGANPLAFTTFSQGTIALAVVRCKVTDSLGQTAYTPNISIT